MNCATVNSRIKTFYEAGNLKKGIDDK